MHFPGEEERKKATEERGYSMAEMKETEKEIERSWNEWRHRFHRYLEILLSDGERGITAIEQAETLADAEQKLLARRKPPGIE